MKEIEMIKAERERQISAKGWTLEHDDTHTKGELAYAACAYAHECAEQSRYPGLSPADSHPVWPWEPESWKPSIRIRNAVKAAALLVAEIERLNRSE